MLAFLLDSFLLRAYTPFPRPGHLATGMRADLYQQHVIGPGSSVAGRAGPIRWRRWLWRWLRSLWR